MEWRNRIVLAAALALLASCGPKALTLPNDPVDRAATCGVVAAAEARLAVTDIQAPLPLEAQGRIAHYALLGASAGGEFSPAIANAISRRTTELGEQVTTGGWQDLVPACAAAFPAAGKSDVALPPDEFDAQFGCYEMAGFLTTVLAGQRTNERHERATYVGLHRLLGDRVAPGLRARAGADRAAQRREQHRALAAAAQLGSPVALMRQCVRRFGG
jgi:acetyl esterase/lipase